MKKDTVLGWLRLLFTPAVICLLGLSMLLRPDSASALVGKVLGWGLVIAGVYYAVTAISTRRNGVHSALNAAIALLLALRLLHNPLWLAAFGGRLVGLILLFIGIGELRDAAKLGLPRLVPGGITAAGVVLLLLPRTASRLLVMLAGAVTLAVGVAMLVSRLRHPRLSPGDDDPNIIDAL